MCHTGCRKTSVALSSPDARQGEFVAGPTHTIPGFLGRVRGLLYRHEGRRFALHGVTAVGALVLVLPFLAKLAATRAGAIAVLGIGVLAAAIAVGGAIVLGIVVPRRRFGADHAVARWVGTREKAIASDLISSVELAAASPTRPGAPSPALVDALITATSERLEDVEPYHLIPEREMARARRGAF